MGGAQAAAEQVRGDVMLVGVGSGVQKRPTDAAGCADTRGGPIPYNQTFAAPDAPSLKTLESDYKIAPMDKLAIKVFKMEDLPGEYSEYTQINADFFTELGSPGGAAKVGLTENDPAAVKSLESRAEAT